jgi:predicted RNA-binding protein with PUA domain
LDYKKIKFPHLKKNLPENWKSIRIENMKFENMEGFEFLNESKVNNNEVILNNSIQNNDDNDDIDINDFVNQFLKKIN